MHSQLSNKTIRATEMYKEYRRLYKKVFGPMNSRKFSCTYQLVKLWVHFTKNMNHLEFLWKILGWSGKWLFVYGNLNFFSVIEKMGPDTRYFCWHSHLLRRTRKIIIKAILTFLWFHLQINFTKFHKKYKENARKILKWFQNSNFSFKNC